MKGKRTNPAFIVSLIGPGGASKTRTALRAPGPVTIISVDPNTEFVAKEEFGEDLDGCTLLPVALPPLAFVDKDDAEKEASRTQEEILEHLRPLAKRRADDGSKRGTIVFDTAEEIYNLAVIATFGKTDQIHPEARKLMLGRVNTGYKSMIIGLRSLGYVVVLLHGPREVWVDAVEGRGANAKDVRKRLDGPFDWERQGYKDTDRLVTVEAVVAFDPKREWKKDTPTPLSYKFGLKYAKNTHRPLLQEQEFWGTYKHADGTRLSYNSIRSIGLQSFPGTTPADWE